MPFKKSNFSLIFVIFSQWLLILLINFTLYCSIYFWKRSFYLRIIDLYIFHKKTRFKNLAFLGMSAHSGSRSRTRRNESAQLEPMRASTHRGQLLLIFRVETLILRKSPRDYKLEKLTFFSQLYLRFRVKISKEIQIFEF